MSVTDGLIKDGSNKNEYGPIRMSVTNGQIMSVADGPIMMIVTFTAEQWNGVTQSASLFPPEGRVCLLAQEVGHTIIHTEKFNISPDC